MSKLQKQVSVHVPVNEEHKHMEGDDQTSVMATKFVDEILESAISVISSKISQLQTITTEGESCLFTKKGDLDESHSPSDSLTPVSEGQGDVQTIPSSTTDNDDRAIWRCVGDPIVSTGAADSTGISAVVSSFDQQLQLSSSDEDLAAWEETNEQTLQVIMHDDGTEEDEKYLDDISKKLPGIPVRTTILTGGVEFSPLIALPGIRLRRRAMPSPGISQQNNPNQKVEIASADSVQQSKSSKDSSGSTANKKKWKIGKRLKKLFGRTKINLPNQPTTDNN
ncbi:uncharacterized protein LOC113371046 [Ctenocephalides felis]|uniref:uncharacterized protein LOC113371046 n=1 Tax=Ctenocephalides felis TaxID=7515 RepID=UPI000E6E3298|nr:uncharacterized protein LOC113371046 [Ctenocephalides felis]